MEISETFVYEGVDVDDAFALITNADFRVQASIAMHAIEQDVNVQSVDGLTTVSIKRVLPAKLPDFVRKLVGETVTVLQKEIWHPPDEEGSYYAEVSVEILGQPASMNAESWLYSEGDSTALSMDGIVKVSIPIIGRKIEAEITKVIVLALGKEVQLGEAHLT